MSGILKFIYSDLTIYMSGILKFIYSDLTIYMSGILKFIYSDLTIHVHMLLCLGILYSIETANPIQCIYHH